MSLRIWCHTAALFPIGLSLEIVRFTILVRNVVLVLQDVRIFREFATNWLLCDRRIILHKLDDSYPLLNPSVVLY